MSAGYGGFPLGDLNWFPAIKANWEAQKNAEYSQINAELESGVLDVEQLGGLPVEFELQQNYPNPFNPTTKISFSIPQAGNVVLKVYNSIGKEVATLVNGYMTAQSYKVDFNASGFASGIYIYKLEYDNSSISKKMVLLK